MAFELKSLGRQKVLYDDANQGNPLVSQLILDGAKVTPTAAPTIAIYRRGSSTALVTATNTTLVSTLFSYEVDTTTEASWPIETGYRAEYAIAYDSNTIKRHLVFDVVRWLLDLQICVDDLVSIDSRVEGWSHTTYDDLSPLIVVIRGFIRIELEHKAVKDRKLVENMILDSEAIKVCGCLRMLAQLSFNRGNREDYTEYLKQYNEHLTMVLAMIKYDIGQDGDEDATAGGLQTVRLVT